MNRAKGKKMLYPFLITLLGAILMLVMLLLPYASAKDKYKDYLENNSDEWYVEEIEMTNADAVNISLIEFVKIYMESAEQELHKETSILCVVMICLFAGFAIFTLLMALLKKPIGIIIFDLLALGVFKLLQFDFEDRGIIPSSSYDWGVTVYLTYIIGVVIIAGAVWLLMEKKKLKKAVKAEPSETV